MSLLKLNRGSEYSLPVELNDGWLYFCTDTGSVFIDHYDSTNTLVRSKVSAEHADKLRYVQSEEPIDAPDGALWIDLDASHVSGLDTVTFPEATASNNGKFLRVVNGAWDVSGDVFLYTKQTLTEEQKNQARNNLGIENAVTDVTLTRAVPGRNDFRSNLLDLQVTDTSSSGSKTRHYEIEQNRDQQIILYDLAQEVENKDEFDLSGVVSPEDAVAFPGDFLITADGDVYLVEQEEIGLPPFKRFLFNLPLSAEPAETTVSMKATASRTAYQISVTVNDVTAKTPAMSFVRYDGNQTGLTDAQKAQAQENIGAAAMIPSSKLGDSISLTDSAAMKLQNLRLFGKTTQNDTPTPEAPVPLASAGDGGTVTAKVMGKNILNVDGMLKPGVLEKHGDEYVLTKTSDSRFSNYVDCFIPKNTYFQAHVNMLENTSVYNDLSMVIDFEDKTNSTIPISSSYRIYQKDITRCQLFLQSEDAVGALQRFKDFQIEYGTTATDYEPYKELQTLTVSTPNGLPGIPVSSGGNYTDEMGQQWICDEVDFSRGVYVQRVGTFIVENERIGTVYEYSNTPNGIVNAFRFKLPTLLEMSPEQINNDILNCYCTHFPYGGYVSRMHKTGFGFSEAHFVYFRFEGDNNEITTIEDFRNFISEHEENGDPISFVYPLETSIETPLSAEELAAYAALHTNHPNTTIFNDGGAGMEVCYTADTKLYIDDQVNAMQPIFVPQELTEAQKTQARANIGAATVNDILAALPTWTGGAY